jgi:hypothetical protein
MMDAQVEYVGFTTKGAHRVYQLRVRRGATEPVDVNVLIASAAFTAGRVRYQDGPEVCFLKLQKELLAAAEGKPAKEFSVSDADLADYKAAHSPKPPQRRPRPPIQNT